MHPVSFGQEPLVMRTKQYGSPFRSLPRWL
jgi:hypothetical protein